MSRQRLLSITLSWPSERQTSERYFREGKIKEIADYCETDVVGTYQLWLRYELFRGTLSQNAFEGSERNLADFTTVRSSLSASLP